MLKPTGNFNDKVMSILVLTSRINSELIDTTKKVLSNQLPSPDSVDESVIAPWTGLEFSLSLIVLIFGLLIIIIEVFLIKNKSVNSGDIIKFVVVTLIITSTLFLITAGYSNDQIAPAMGLLGTIAGYLLGRNNPTKENQDEKTS